MDICEKVAYIKGLAEGLELDNDSKEGKILAAIIDVLGDITEEICDIEDGCDALMEQIDAVDEDLSYVEEIIYGDDDECDCDCCDGDCEDDDQLYEVECPACNDVIYLDEDMLCEGGIACPNCGTDLEFDFDCDCDCDCCDGDCEAEQE